MDIEAAMKSIDEELSESTPTNSNLPAAEEIEREMVEALNSKEFQEIDPEELKHNTEQSVQSTSSLIPTRTSTPHTPSIPVTSISIPKSNSNYNNNSVDEETLSDIDDADVEKYCCTKEEIDLKTQLWNELNRDYLERIAEKEKESNGKAQPKVINLHFHFFHRS